VCPLSLIGIRAVQFGEYGPLLQRLRRAEDSAVLLPDHIGLGEAGWRVDPLCLEIRRGSLGFYRFFRLLFFIFFFIGDNRLPVEQRVGIFSEHVTTSFITIISHVLSYGLLEGNVTTHVEAVEISKTNEDEPVRPR